MHAYPGMYINIVKCEFAYKGVRKWASRLGIKEENIKHAC